MKTIILICRSFGDAVISTSLIESIGQSFPNLRVDVLTRPQFEPIFKYNPHIENLFFAQYPMGLVKNMNAIETLHLIRQIKRLRKIRYDRTINMIGDFREILLGKLIGSKQNITISWKQNHGFRKQIRQGFLSLADHIVEIPNNISNIYDAVKYLAQQSGCKKLCEPTIYDKNSKPFRWKHQSWKHQSWQETEQNRAIGIHPFANQQSRQWQIEKWKSLIESLKKDFLIYLFCAPNEQSSLFCNFKTVIDNDRVIPYALPLYPFFEKLTDVLLFVGLDSFSIHAANALKTPFVMLNGANDYKIWAPPNGEVIRNSEVCKYYPCYNKALCIKTPDQYKCIKSISVETVYEQIMNSVTKY